MAAAAQSGTTSGSAQMRDPISAQFDRLLGDPQTATSSGSMPTEVLRVGDLAALLPPSTLAERSITIRFSSHWRDQLAASPDFREDLQTTLASVLNGLALTSPDELLKTWAASLHSHALLRWWPDEHVIEVDALQAASSDARTSRPVSSRVGSRPVPATSAEQPNHARLASELRSMSGMTTRRLAEGFGVTREQYSRWTGGAPISEVKHGQLIYLHTVIKDLVRRLGLDEARTWLRTPLDGEITPADIISTRRWSELHRLVTGLPDAAPVVDNVMVALAIQEGPTADDVGETGVDTDDSDDSWSPYGPESS